MIARLRRIGRLVERAEEACKAARAAAAQAARVVEEARRACEPDERAWSAAAERFGADVTRIADLDEQAAHVRTLRLRADASARRLERAVADERRCAGAAVQAATDLRKLELLRDRIVEANREEESRQERRHSDELAARAAARSKP